MLLQIFNFEIIVIYAILCLHKLSKSIYDKLYSQFIIIFKSYSLKLFQMLIN